MFQFLCDCLSDNTAQLRNESACKEESLKITYLISIRFY